MTFQYRSDVGIPSYHELEAFCRRSGIGFSVSSATSGNHGATSFHYTGNAVDLVSSNGSMQQLAAWLYNNYSPYLLELIHSGGNGYFVKDGQKVPGSFYGAATIAEHYNHVHVAATLSGIAAASGANPSGTDTLNASDATIAGGTGCAIPTAMFVIGLVSTCGGFLWTLL